MRSTRLLMALATAGVVVAAVAGPVSAATPTITVAPNRKLVDGQQVTVSASGFAPNTEMAVAECPTSSVSPATCDFNTLEFVETDANGAYSGVSFTVFRTLSDGTDCVTAGGCYIGTQDGEGKGTTAATLIKFDATIPPFTMTVRVDHVGTVNSKGVVALRGVVHCENGNAFADIQLGLRQVVDRSIYTSSGFTATACAAGGTTAFRVTVRPQNGFFGAGAASVFVFAQANNHFVQHKVGVTLVER